MPFLPRLRWPGIRRAGTAALTVALLLIVAWLRPSRPTVSSTTGPSSIATPGNSLFVMIIRWVGGFVFVSAPGSAADRGDDQVLGPPGLARRLDACPWEYHPGDRVDRDPGADPDGHRRADGADDLPHPGQGEVGRAPGHGGRTPMVVGVSVSGLHVHGSERQDRHAGDGQRAVPPARPNGELHAQERGRDSLVLDPGHGRQARSDRQSH